MAEDNPKDAGAPEVEVTPAMKMAGEQALAEHFFELVDSHGYPEIARIVYEAMEAVRRGQESKVHQT